MREAKEVLVLQMSRDRGKEMLLSSFMDFFWPDVFHSYNKRRGEERADVKSRSL